MERRDFVRATFAWGGAAGIGGALGSGLAGAPAARAAGASAPAGAATVRDFGAKGDGKTDDTAALERAVAEGSGPLLLPPGSYRVTRPVRVVLDERGPRSIIGTGEARILADLEGPALDIVGTHRGTADPGGFEDRVWDRQRLPLVTGLEIRGVHKGAIGLRLERTMQATLTAVLIRRCATGIVLAERNRNLVIDGCHVYDNDAVGIHFDHVNLHQSIITSSHVSYNPRAGIWIEGGEIRNLQIVGCDIEYNHDAGAKAEEGVAGSADVLVDVREDGASCREMTIVGNTIQARPCPGGANVRILGGDGVRTAGMIAITGNLIGSQTDNVHLSRCRNVSLTGNAIYSAADRSVRVETSANVVVSGNSIDWNPDHGGKRLVDGIRVEDSDGVQLSGLVLESSFQGSQDAGAAIEVARSRDVSIADCQVLDPRHRALELDGVTRCRVSGSSFVDRREGDARSMVEAVRVTGESRDVWITSSFLGRGGDGSAPKVPEEFLGDVRIVS